MRTIFLDLDGVLADFDRGVFLATGKTPDQIADDDVMWAAIKQVPNFFLNLPKMVGADQFVSYVLSIAAYNRCAVSVLTGLPNPDKELADADVQKRSWVATLYPVLATSVHCCLSKEKQLFCKPGDVLIDDRRDNITRWKKAGGHGILFRDPELAVHELYRLFSGDEA